MGLAEQLAINPDEMTWEDWAACRGAGWNAFFEGYEEDSSTAKAIDQLCSTCPVQRSCGNYGRQNRLEGVWGGMYLSTQGKVDPKRNEHKTDAEWKRLKEIFDWL